MNSLWFNGILDFEGYSSVRGTPGTKEKIRWNQKLPPLFFIPLYKIWSRDLFPSSASWLVLIAVSLTDRWALRWDITCGAKKFGTKILFNKNLSDGANFLIFFRKGELWKNNKFWAELDNFLLNKLFLQIMYLLKFDVFFT